MFFGDNSLGFLTINSQVDKFSDRWSCRNLALVDSLVTLFNKFYLQNENNQWEIFVSVTMRTNQIPELSNRFSESSKIALFSRPPNKHPIFNRFLLCFHSADFASVHHQTAKSLEHRNFEYICVIMLLYDIPILQTISITKIFSYFFAVFPP